ncbi:MAG: hypothetical protein KBA75_05205 [Alphaproteobacteria bacterium]|nr:hypothetical protein [Alphaproteobacteria bacterium]
MIITILIYLLISVPILMILLSWKITGDKKAGWALPSGRRDKFLWSIVGVALAFPLLLTGLGCTIFNVGVYGYSTIGRVTGSVHGENYDIMFLFALIVSIPMAVVGFFGLRYSWRKLRRVLLNQPTAQVKDDF